jgi:predicted Zn-dependent protease
MSNYDKLIDVTIGITSDKLEKAIKESAAKVRASAKDADEPWQKSVILILAISLEREGIKGLQNAEKCLKNLLHGKTANLSDLPLLARSEALEMMQKVEARDRSEAAAYVSIAGDIVSAIISASLKGLVI